MSKPVKGPKTFNTAKPSISFQNSTPNRPAKQNNSRSRRTQAFRNQSSRPLAARLPEDVESHSRQAAQFMDPGRFNSSVLIPDRSSKVRCTRRFQKVLNISSTTAGCANGFTLVARPDLDLPYAVSGPTSVIPSIAGPYTMKGHVRPSVGFTNTLEGDSYKVDAITQVGIGRLKWDPAVNGGSFRVGANCGVGTSEDAYLEYSQETISGGCHVDIYKLLAGTWTTVYRGVPSGMIQKYTLGTAGFDDIAFAFSSVRGDTTFRYKIVVGGNVTGQVTTTQDIDLPSSNFVSEFAGIARGGRLTAMSVLVTNTSPELANGGTIYAARVPSDVAYYTPPASMLSKCPGMHRGDAADGAYTWWLPSEQSAQTYLDSAEAIEQLRLDNYLWVNLSGWGGANPSSAIATITWVVEFFAESQLYEKLVPPPRDQAWDETFQLLYRMPEASCNPAHTQMFRNLIQAAKDSYSKANAHYKRHKTLYDTLLNTLLSAAA
jgi:hypothetical protein